MKSTAYFEEMRRVSHEWQVAKDERMARKQRIIDEFGYDSGELNAWYAEAAPAFPYSNGASKAYRAWENSAHVEDGAVEMSDFCFDSEVHDFIATLRAAGVRMLYYTNRSTAVMGNLHAFAAEGCTLEGLCTVTRHETRWGDEAATEAPGILFVID